MRPHIYLVFGYLHLPEHLDFAVDCGVFNHRPFGLVQRWVA